MPNNYRVRRIFIVRPWPSLCSPMLPDTDVRCPRVGSSLTEILVEINSQLLSRFLSWTKELIFEERTTTNKPWRNRIEDIFEGKEEREKETRRYSRIVLNAETRGWIALKPTRRTSSWTSVKRVICFTGVPTRRDVVSRAKTRCQYSAWTAWISSIDCLTLTDTNLCPSDIRATFETKRICSCAPDCLSWFLDFTDEDKTFGFNFFENLISKMECKVRSTNFVFSEVFLIWKLIYIVVLIDFYYILCLITNESFEVSFFF